MWHDLLTAIGLMLVLEGILPFLNPPGVRQALLQISQMDDRTLRVTGFASMALGVIVLYIIGG